MSDTSKKEPGKLRQLRVVADNDLYVVTDSQIADCTMSTTVLKPGKATRGHRHVDGDDTYCFLYGEADLVIDGEPHRVTKHLSYFVPGDKWHQVRNISERDVAVFVCMFRGTRDARNYDYVNTK